jgi:prevent-host-death family protein
MKTFTANETKQNFGQVLDSARSGPVTITKHGRPEFILTSKEDYDNLARAKFERLKSEVQKGIDAFDRGEVSTRTFEEILAEVISKHEKTADRKAGA